MKYIETNLGSFEIQPSRIVVLVESCQRAIPSLSTYFNTAPMITAHNTATPYCAPATEADIRSPAPIPVAATARPGPINFNESKSEDFFNVRYDLAFDLA